jgi:Protein of unknown function (DUF2442)
MIRPVEVKALSDYRIWIRYADGTQGEVDLSRLAGRGVFALWQDPDAFRNVRLGPHGAIVWTDEVEICADSVYLQVTGKSPDEVFPNVARAAVGA